MSAEHPLDRVIRRLEAADGVEVVYGIRDEPHHSGLSTTELARILIEGTRDGRIPPRDFMAVAAQDVEVVARPRLRAIARKLLRGEDPSRELSKLSDAAREAVSRAIDTFHTPENAPSTVRSKGRNDPLVDLGDLLAAADAEVIG